MNPRCKFFDTREIFFYYNLNFNRIEVSNNENYPALPFICSYKKHLKTKPYNEYPQHNLYYILADDGKDLNDEQREVIRTYKLNYSSDPTHVPLMINKQNILDIIKVFQDNLSQYQIMHIIAADLNQKTV